jgi:hypothetical protein
VVRLLIMVLAEPPLPMGGTSAKWYYVLYKGRAARGHRITPLGPCATSDYIAQAGKLFATLDYDLRCYSYARRSRLAAKWESLRQPSSYPYSPELRWDLAAEISPKMDG